MSLHLKRNIHSALLLRILILLLLFTLTRITFYFFNTGYFTGINFVELMKILFYGLRFDLSTIIMLNALYIFMNIIPFRIKHNLIYQRIANVLFIITNSFALALNCIDFIYFRFTLKRSTADLFSMVGFGDDFTILIPQFLKDFWYVALIWVIIVVLLIYLYHKTRFMLNITASNLKYYFIHGFLFIAFTVLSVIGIRGGLQLRPISIITASQYASAQNIPIVLNTPFTIIKTINKSELKNVWYFQDVSELNNIYNPVHTVPVHPSEEQQNFKPLNVVIIILESFSKEHIASLNNNNHKGYTPFLDSLIAQSLVFPNMYANGKKSIEAIPAIISGIPTLMNNPFISSPYAGNKIYSLANLLKTKGYNSAFYHGGNNGTMGFDNFSKLAGFDNYYGRNEYNNDKDYDGKWGIYDEQFFQYTARNLNKTKQPFFATIMSLSSHHPYKIPDKYLYTFQPGELEIHQSIRYTDYSLSKFFKTISAMSWFDNTLFVITADHTSNAIHPYYQNRVGMYAIPLLFYKHNSNLKGSDSILTQQTDIMPSVLSYLNYDIDYIAFGENVFTNIADRMVVNYLNNTYQLIKDNYVIHFDGEKSIALYDLKNDSLLQNNLLNSHRKIAEEMETHIKAFIQNYNNRMISNKLTID